MAFPNGTRVKWMSHTEKLRYGTFIMKMQSRPGFVLIKGEDGKAHVMKEGKPEVVKKEAS